MVAPIPTSLWNRSDGSSTPQTQMALTIMLSNWVFPLIWSWISPTDIVPFHPTILLNKSWKCDGIEHLFYMVPLFLSHFYILYINDSGCGENKSLEIFILHQTVVVQHKIIFKSKNTELSW